MRLAVPYGLGELREDFELGLLGSCDVAPKEDSDDGGKTDVGYLSDYLSEIHGGGARGC
jgi:hypothetical protein